MQIKKTTQTNDNQTSYKGIPIARVTTKMSDANGALVLYKLNASDIPFLEKMVSKINLKKLYPNEKNYSGFSEWKSIIEKAAAPADSNQNVILATHNKKPCGIIRYNNENQKEFFIEAFATWVTKAEEKLKYTGLSLMRKLFDDANSSNKSLISLSPSLSRPRGKSCIDFYEKMDFDFYGDYKMISKPKDVDFKKKCDELDKLMEYKKLYNEKNVNLNRALKLNYNKTPLKVKIKQIKENLNKIDICNKIEIL